MSGKWWIEESAGSQLPCYETIAALDAAYPAPVLGQKIGMRRLCGNGYFEQMYNGTRWEVMSGESIISDMGVGGLGYLLTATGSSSVQMQQYVIPANLIGDKETWVISIDLRNDGVYTAGYCSGDVTLGEMSNVFQVDQISTLNGVARLNSIFTRRGASLIRRRYVGLTYISGIDDASTDLSIAKNATLSAKALTAGDTVRIRKWSIARNEAV